VISCNKIQTNHRHKDKESKVWVIFNSRQGTKLIGKTSLSKHLIDNWRYAKKILIIS
jgi:hypothetical protein